MPKSFLVKTRQKFKEDAGLEENIFNDQDATKAAKVKQKTSQSISSPKSNVILDADPSASPSPQPKQTRKRVIRNKSKSPAQPMELVKHEKIQSTGHNINLCQNINTDIEKAESDISKKKCDRCHRTYATNSALVKHQRYYCNFFQTKSFTCKYCDKVYMSLGALKMHIRTHTLPCRCVICGKSFSRPWLLQGHIRTHTGEKPYACSSCNRAFADRSNLRAHLQTHSDVKKYKCEQCSKTFSRMSLLIKHSSICCSI